MRGPRAAVVGALVDQYWGTRPGDRCVLEDKWTSHMFPSRDAGVGIGGAEKINGQFSVRKKFFPNMHGKCWVCRGEDGDEVVFPHANDSFCLVLTVVIGGHILDGYLSGVH